MSPKAKADPTYRAAVGIDFNADDPDAHVRVEAGEDIPAGVTVAAWLVEQGLVYDPSNPDAKHPASGEYMFDVQHATVDEVVAWVDGDPNRAAYALAKESEPDVDERVTLRRELEEVLAAPPAAPAPEPSPAEAPDVDGATEEPAGG